MNMQNNKNLKNVNSFQKYNDKFKNNKAYLNFRQNQKYSFHK